MMKLKISFLILCVGNAAVAQSKCECRSAKKVVSYGGNYDGNEQQSETVSLIGGKIVDGFDSPIENAVIELFDYRNGKQELIEVPNHAKRRRACVTKEDGKFCFDGVRAGKYLLRVGAASPMYLNRTYMIVNLKPRDKNLRSKVLEILLEPAF